MSWLFKSEEQRKKEKADRAQWAEWEKQSQEFASKLNEKARNRKERLARGEQVRRIVQAGYAPGAFDEEWHTAEEWAEINRATKESDAKRWREEEEKYAPVRRAREKEKKNAEITKCRQVIAEANTASTASGGNRTKKYRKNKNKNTRRKH